MVCDALVCQVFDEGNLEFYGRGHVQVSLYVGHSGDRLDAFKRINFSDVSLAVIARMQVPIAPNLS